LQPRYVAFARLSPPLGFEGGMVKDSLITGLDIGASKVAISVGRINEGTINIVAMSHVACNGLRRGVIDDIEETVSAISHTLEEAERMAGAPITNAFVNINGGHIDAQPAKGVVAVSKPSGQIDQSDVVRVIEAAKAVALPQNRELIHIFPRYYIIDGNEELRDPIGMNGLRLEMESLVISASSLALRNIVKTVERAGLEINEIVFGPLAAAKALTTKKQRESGVVVVDIGAGSTALAVYEENELLHAASIPVGSKHITNDIAIGLRKNLDLADLIKTQYGHALPETVRESEVINLASLDPTEDEKVSRRQVAEIVEARITEIFDKIKEELRRVSKDGLLPAGVVFTGGGSELEGITELARKYLRLPASIGCPSAPISGMIDKIDNPIYATSAGLVLWGYEESDARGSSWRLNLGRFGGVFERFRGMFRNFTN